MNTQTYLIIGQTYVSGKFIGFISEICCHFVQKTAVLMISFCSLFRLSNNFIVLRYNFIVYDNNDIIIVTLRCQCLHHQFICVPNSCTEAMFELLNSYIQVF